jgi:hypothetical protein
MVASQTILIIQAPINVLSIGSMEYPMARVKPGKYIHYTTCKICSHHDFNTPMPNSITLGSEVYMLSKGLPKTIVAAANNNPGCKNKYGADFGNGIYSIIFP